MSSAAEREVIAAALALSEAARRAIVWPKPGVGEPDEAGERLYRALVALEFERVDPALIASAKAGIAAYKAAYNESERAKKSAFDEMVRSVQMKTPFTIYQRLWDEAEGKKYP